MRAVSRRRRLRRRVGVDAHDRAAGYLLRQRRVDAQFVRRVQEQHQVAIFFLEFFDSRVFYRQFDRFTLFSARRFRPERLDVFSQRIAERVRVLELVAELFNRRHVRRVRLLKHFQFTFGVLRFAHRSRHHGGVPTVLVFSRDRPRAPRVGRLEQAFEILALRFEL